MDLYAVPPALVGRLVTVIETPLTGGSSGDEVVKFRGYISAEMASGIHDWFTTQCISAWRTGLVNEKPVAYQVDIGSDSGLSGAISTIRFRPIDPPPVPFGNDSGGYWCFAPSYRVYSLAYSSGWLAQANSVWTTDEEVAATSTFRGDRLYPILFSAGTYPSFGSLDTAGGTYADSDNPVVIALNILMSIDGTNYDGTEAVYDKGAYLGTGATAGGLYPNFSMGVDRDQIDLASFESALKTRLSGIHADQFWLGGPEPETIESIMFRLFAPVGYVCGTNRAGVWTLLHLGDVYPGETGLAVSHVHSAEEITHRTQSRALDWIEIEASPGPDGENTLTVIVDEEDGRVFYPDHIGERITIPNAPYSHYTYDSEDSLAVGLLSSKIRRLADRVAVVEFQVGPEYYGELDIGTKVSVYDAAIRNPETGQSLAAGETLLGIVASISGDAYNRRERVVVWLQSADEHLCLMSPSAYVESWDVGTLTLTVSEHAYTRDTDTEGDGEKFAAGDHVVLVDSHGVVRSGYTVANNKFSTVVDVTATTIQVDQMVTEAGAPLTPGATDRLVYAHYSEVDTQQIGTYGYDASGGDSTSSAPSLSGDDPNEYGS